MRHTACCAYQKPIKADEAVDLVKAGKMAFVRRSDAHKVLDALGVRLERAAGTAQGGSCCRGVVVESLDLGCVGW